MTEPSSKPELDELQAWLVKVGDTRPPVEPDLDAIVGRAGQRVFRRRIGTGLGGRAEHRRRSWAGSRVS